jgi:hypothetical protein
MGQIKRIAPRIFQYLKNSGVLVISHLPIPEATRVVALGASPLSEHYS